jgi:hypothetical protein
MSSVSPLQTPAQPAQPARLLLAYGGLCALCWTLYAVAVTDWQRGHFQLLAAVYEATWALWPAMLLGLAVLPWVRALQAAPHRPPRRLLLHVGAALVFSALWQGLAYAAAGALYGREHASATAEQQLVWQSTLGFFVYGALVLGFGGALHAQRAHAAALSAARAEAALARAELAAINGKLNPHFLFNTLNSLRLLTVKDPPAAAQALLSFARMMRYVLDTQRASSDRVRLADELDFVRDYLALEALRLGPRLVVAWHIDPATLDDEVPPLTLQPLVENSIQHGIAPRVQGGTVRIESRRQVQPAALALRVADDGDGCTWPPLPLPAPRGVGLSALLRRFELDYEGRARLAVASAPGAGFCVDILIPLDL